jgi:hypothetical protein
MNNKISYYIITSDSAAGFTADDEQLNLIDVLTVEECEKLHAAGVDFYFSVGVNNHAI